MKLQTLSDYVDLLAISMECDPNDVQTIRENRRDRGAIIDVVVGREQRASVD